MMCTFRDSSSHSSWVWILLILAILHGRPTSSFTFPPVSHQGILHHAALTSSHVASTMKHSFNRQHYDTHLYLVKDKKETTKNSVDESSTRESVPDTDSTIFGFPQDIASPLALLLLSQFILFIGVGAVIPSIPLYGKEIGLSGAANGVVISAPAVASLLGAKRSGTFADQARKPAMLIGMAIITISDIGTALAGTLVTLTLARLGLGAGRIISESGERGMLADLAGQAPEMRGRALAAQQAIIALGIAIGAPAGGYIVELYGPRASFLCVSAAAAVTFCTYLFLPETVGSNIVDTKESRNGTAKKRDSGEWTSLLKESKWKGLALCQIGASCGFAAKIASIPILAADTLPGGAVGAGALLSAAGLSGLIGAPIGGWLTDQTSAKSTAILSGIISAVGLFLIPFALNSLTFGDETVSLLGQTMSGQAAAFSIVVLMWSIGAAAQGPALTALAQELAPAGAEATAMALPRAAGDGTYIVAPFLLGLVSDMDISVPGTDCAAAGTVGLLGVLALATFGNVDDRSTKESTG